MGKVSRVNEAQNMAPSDVKVMDSENSRVLDLDFFIRITV